MKYIGLAEFLQLPSGTVYMAELNPSGEPGYSGDLMMKGETLSGNDWLDGPMIELGLDPSTEEDAYNSMISDGVDMPLKNPIYGRFGEFPAEGKIMFWVLTPADVRALVGILQSGLLGQN